MVSRLDYSKLIVAYEPVWAIGTGRSASIEEITNIHNRLKERIDRPEFYMGEVLSHQILQDIAPYHQFDGVWVGRLAFFFKGWNRLFRKFFIGLIILNWF